MLVGVWDKGKAWECENYARNELSWLSHTTLTTVLLPVISSHTKPQLTTQLQSK
jgi:hypothetical protein